MVFDVSYSVLQVAESLGGDAPAQLPYEELGGVGDSRMKGDGVDSAQYQRVSLHVVAAGRAERWLPN